MPKVKLLDPADARRRLDRYELIGELASGGMATVFLARLAGVGGFQRFVAIKRLHPHLAAEQEFVEMFLDEARLAAGIHHQHVVPILEVGMAGALEQGGDPAAAAGGFYLVMEYIEGDTLARVFSRSLSLSSPTPYPVLIRILLDTLAGLHAAHELTDGEGRPVHLVHRDCSPQNILVGVDGCSRITDFGVARATSRLANTRSDRLKGKLAYMAPEQVRGGEMDRRADLFAMGIVLWEVLAGRRLFKAESEAATLSRVVLEPVPRLRDVAPGAAAALDAVCAKALERDPGDRYQSAAEMAEALERAAREAAGGSDAGVAAARDVAGYVQRLLGEEIAAQRESVRAWLQTGATWTDANGRPRPDLVPVSSVRGARAVSSFPPGRASSDDPTLTAPSGSSRASHAPESPTMVTAGERLGGSEVIPVELPPDPPAPADDDPGTPAREASLTGALAFSRRPSVAPYATPLGELTGARGRSRLAGAFVALALVGGALFFFWRVQRPQATAVADGMLDPAQAGAAGGVRVVSVPDVPPAPSAASPAASAAAPAQVGAAPRSNGAAVGSGRRAAAGRTGTPLTKAPPVAPTDDLANPYR